MQDFNSGASGPKEFSGFGQPGWSRRERALLRFYYLEHLLNARWLRWRYRHRVRFGKDVRVDPHTLMLRGTGTVELGDRVIFERGLFKVFFNLDPGAKVKIGEGTWFRMVNDHIIFTVKPGAEVVMGKNCWCTGGHYSASKRISVGEHTLIGKGVTILDSDLHQVDNLSEVKTAPVNIGSHVWITSYVTILKGVTIGDHCIISTGSIVNQDVPDHSLVAGAPARVIQKISDRDRVP